jgi:hypothetical protein
MRDLTKLVIVLLASAVGVLGASWLVRSGTDQPATEGRENGSLYNPVHSGEEVPAGFRQLLARDAIRPVYDPVFVSASKSGWHDQTLVVGLEIDGDARAYPVSFLNRREIVNDHVGKTPVLVTW